DEDFSDFLERVILCPATLDNPLEVGVPYIIRLNERFALPTHIRAKASPKSTVGRSFLHVRLLSERGAVLDRLPGGYEGDIWAMVVSRSFVVQLRRDLAISQMRFFSGEPRLGHEEFVAAYNEHPFLWLPVGAPIPFESITLYDGDGALIIRSDLESDIVAWRTRTVQDRVFDFSVPRETYNPSDFFDAIEKPKSGYLALERGRGYILSSYEFVSFSEKYASEMEVSDSGSGDFRVHSAGFFDPGFGYGSDGSVRGTPATFEITPYEDNLIFAHKQRAAKMFVEHLSESADTLYGDVVLGSSYLFQRGPKLPKQFKEVSRRIER
ncbi:MAG: 2'-deoxycytidine 5'-triphosphate deaminase, partial [Patescibacteria group bacterium]